MRVLSLVNQRPNKIFYASNWRLARQDACFLHYLLFDFTENRRGFHREIKAEKI
jgi:hypothetical protein